ncbi:hypothetical protein Ancab_005834, partial [Ancistrocladus abbreviatus]
SSSGGNTAPSFSSNQIWEFLSKIGVEAETDTEPILQRLDSMEQRDVMQFQSSEQ